MTLKFIKKNGFVDRPLEILASQERSGIDGSEACLSADKEQALHSG